VKAVKVFLDTNAIVSLVSDPQSFPDLTNYNLCTFEKCIYEFGNGVKTRLFNQQFVVDFLNATLGETPEETQTKDKSFTERVAEGLIESTLKELGLKSDVFHSLVVATKRYDLRYEFGTAEEHPELLSRSNALVEDNNDRGVFLLKRFYSLLRSKLGEELYQIEQKFRQFGLEVISYEQVFCSGNNMLDFRMLLKDSFLPTEDLEIVFSAISQGCKVFVTDDGKAKRKGILQDSRTLGLNYAIEFIGIEEFRRGMLWHK
jgi:hypothetical protein